MKKQLLALAALFTFGHAYSQSYYILNKTGTGPEYVITGNPGFATIMTPPATGSLNNVLSPAQVLPFAWKFYGQDVTQFKVSENGYITFDTSQTESIGVNTALPSAATPNNAIYAYWDDLEFRRYAPQPTVAVGVRTWTYGTAPNRVHVIQWMVANPVQNPDNTQNLIYAGIRIYEAGDFDIVQAYGFGAFSATAGVENADGTAATMISGSPSMGVPSGTGESQLNTVYEFHYGTQPQADIVMLGSTMRRYTATTDDYLISGGFINYGSQAINSFTLNYSVNGGQVVSQNITGLNIGASGAGTYMFSHGTPWKGGTPGQLYNLKVWATNINGLEDGDHSNDTLKQVVFVNNGTAAPKNILLEEYTGAWCIHCPEGHVVMKEILANDKNIIGVGHHYNGNGTQGYEDRMTNVESNKVIAAFSAGFPSATINRTYFYDQPTVAVQRDAWEEKLIEHMNIKSPVNVSVVNKSYDEATRKLTFTVKANFVDYAYGDLRIGAMVVEDNVRGTGTGWDQRIHPVYLEDPENTFYDYPVTASSGMRGYIHNHVVTSMPSGAWGTAGVIPQMPAPGASYEKTYTYTLPATTTATIPEDSRFKPTGEVKSRFKPEDMHVVGFVSYFNNNNDVTQLEVLNAKQQPLLGWNTGVKEEKADLTSSNLYPNPVRNIANFSFEVDKTSQVSAEVYNALGQKVQHVINGNYVQGQHTIYFSAETLENGIYFLNITINGVTTTKRFAVVK